MIMIVFDIHIYIYMRSAAYLGTSRDWVLHGEREIRKDDSSLKKLAYLPTLMLF